MFLFDRHVAKTAQSKNICSSAVKCVKYLGRIRPYRSDDSAKSVVHDLITSKVDICNFLLDGLPSSALKSVQGFLTYLFMLF